MVSVRTNGNPYLLYLTKNNFVPQCIFIDKKIQQGYHLPRMIISHFHFDEDLFDNTLLDGEMVKDESGNWIYLIHDIYLLRGRSMRTEPLDSRLMMIHDIFSNKFDIYPTDICSIEIKKHAKVDTLENFMQDFVEKLPYTCRGLYFKPMNMKFRDILFNFNDSLIQTVVRVKYQEDGVFKGSVVKDNSSIVPIEHIIQDPIQMNSKIRKLNLRMTDLPDVYNMFCPDSKELMGFACINTLQTSKMVVESFKNGTLNTVIPFECMYDTKFSKWTPVKTI
jgi:hypothetical protein